MRFTEKNNIKNFLIKRLPILNWSLDYQKEWLLNDIIAGLIIWILVIPQGLAYSNLAQLPPQYGLYSAFIGPILYCFLGTAKDMALGPTAVLSLLTGQVLNQLPSDMNPLQVVYTLTFFSGCFMLQFLLIRGSFMIDFIPEEVIIGFTSGSAITIILSQIPSLFGITKNISKTSYLGVIQMFERLDEIIWTDFLLSVFSLLFLFTVEYLKNKMKDNQIIFYFSILKNVILLLVTCLITFLISNFTTWPISLIHQVPKGLPSLQVPNLLLFPRIWSSSLLICFISILEHVAIGKSLGRKNNYRPNMEQEILSLSVINLFSSFVQSYPVTGSFSRSVVLSKCEVRSPLSGLVTGISVMLTLSFMTQVFWYISKSVLASIIVSAAIYLLPSLNTLQLIYNQNRFGFFILILTFILCIFLSLEWAVLISALICMYRLMFRLARPKIEIYQERLQSLNMIHLIIYEKILYCNAEYILSKYHDFLLNNLKNEYKHDSTSSPTSSLYSSSSSEVSIEMFPETELKYFILIDFKSLSQMDHITRNILQSILQISQIHFKEVRVELILLGDFSMDELIFRQFRDEEAFIVSELNGRSETIITNI